MNLAHSLTQAALKWPEKTALVFEGRRWTYGEWNRLVNKAAHAFRNAGIAKGDRVAILTYNLPEQVTAFYALLKIGAIPVPINYRLAANEVKYILDNSRARILMFEEALRAPVETIKDRIGVERLLYVGAKPAGGETRFEDFIAPGAESEPEADVSWHDARLYYVHLRHHRPTEGCGALPSRRLHGRIVHVDRVRFPPRRRDPQ